MGDRFWGLNGPLLTEMSVGLLFVGLRWKCGRRRKGHSHAHTLRLTWEGGSGPGLA